MKNLFSSILVTVTEACNVGCAHCGFIGSRRAGTIDAREMVDWVGQACSYGIPAIVFTGGEPFDRYELLRQGVRAAFDRSVPSAVFTSSYWATSVETAVALLRELRGLRRLYLSTDVYHQQRIPYQYVHNVIAAADTLNIPEISLCITYATEEDRRKVRDSYMQYGARVRFYEPRVIPTPFNKKALKTQDPMLKASSDNFKSACWIETPIINPNGDLFACHAGAVAAHGNMEDLPYWLGNLRRDSFEAIMKSARRKVEWLYLRTNGSSGVARLFEEFAELGSAVGRSEFTGPCDMCFSVLSTKEGKRSLTEYSHRPEALSRINIWLALYFGERPLELPVLT